MQVQLHWKRNAGFFIAGQFLSLFGSMLVSHSITWHITLREQSGVLMALFTTAAMLPLVVVSPLAGFWADRYNRKVLVNLSDAAIALLTLLVAIIYQSGAGSIGILAVVVAARSVGQGIQAPAVSALIPQIVPPEHLARFNGIQSTVQSLTMFAAPMAAGALLEFLPLQIIFYIDVITASIGISTVFLFVKVPALSVVSSHRAGLSVYFSEMRTGIHFIRQHAWLKTMFITAALFGILASPAAILTPLQVARTFGPDVWRMPAIQVAFSLGMLAGGVLISAWGGFRNKTYTMVLAFFIFGFTTVLFGVTTNFRVYLGIMALCGSSMPIFNTPAMTMIQLGVQPELMGRVISVMMMINGISMPLGLVLFGPLSDAVRIEQLLIATGGLLLTGAALLSQQKALVQAGSQEFTPVVDEISDNREGIMR